MQEAGWATTAHLPMQGHDIGDCIMTQGLGVAQGHTTTRSAAREHGLASEGSRYKILYHS